MYIIHFLVIIIIMRKLMRGFFLLSTLWPIDSFLVHQSMWGMFKRNWLPRSTWVKNGWEPLHYTTGLWAPIKCIGHPLWQVEVQGSSYSDSQFTILVLYCTNIACLMMSLTPAKRILAKKVWLLCIHAMAVQKIICICKTL